MTKALRIGRAVQTARTLHSDPITAVLESESGKLLFRGKVKVFCDDPLAAMGTKSPVPKEIESAYRELCAKYGAGKSTYQLTIDKPTSNLQLELD